MRPDLALLVALTVLATASPADAAKDASDVEGMPPVGHEMWRKHWSWTVIDDSGLALGGGGLEPDDLHDLQARGFRAILNYRGEFPEEEAYVREAGMEYLFIHSTFAEADMMPVEEVEAAVAFIEENLAAGRPVYVHCTGGLHRSLVGVVAYFMKTEGWTYDEAYAHVKALRPSVMPWFSEALLAYEQHLYGGEKLSVDLWTPRWNVAPNETLPVHALVTRDGKAVAAALVRFTSETERATAEKLTDEDGRVEFEFRAAEKPNVQYVSARASLEGHIDGYDRNVYWVGSPKSHAPTVLDVADPAPVPPGGEVVLDVRVHHETGESANARIAITSVCGTHHREYTGWDGRIDARFRAPDADGTYTLLVHANRFNAEPVFRELTLIVGNGGPAAATCARDAVPLAASPSPPAPPSVQAPAPAEADARPDDLTTKAAVPGAGIALVSLGLALAALSAKPRGRR